VRPVSETPIKASLEFVIEVFIAVISKGVFQVKIIIEPITAANLANRNLRVCKKFIGEGSNFGPYGNRTESLGNPSFRGQLFSVG
jgi:hypothetical protein